jgi:Flp pilus assembly protein TadD
LRDVVLDEALPGMVRASALALLAQFPGVDLSNAVTRAAQDGNALVRRSAMAALDSLSSDRRIRLGVPGLTDPVRAVRMEAARALAGAPPQSLQPDQRRALEVAIEEYRQAQDYNADRPESHLNLGLLETRLRQVSRAEASYRQALQLDPRFLPAYVNLADLYRLLDRDAEGEPVLREAMKQAPENGDVHHALGLLLVRQGRMEEALVALQDAARLRPDEPRYAFVLGVALQDTGQLAQAQEILEQAHARHPRDGQILSALVALSRERGLPQEALRYAGLLLELHPGDPAVQQMFQEVQAEQ